MQNFLINIRIFRFRIRGHPDLHTKLNFCKIVEINNFFKLLRSLFPTIGGILSQPFSAIFNQKILSQDKILAKISPNFDQLFEGSQVFLQHIQKFFKVLKIFAQIFVLLFKLSFFFSKTFLQSLKSHSYYSPKFLKIILKFSQNFSRRPFSFSTTYLKIFF